MQKPDQPEISFQSTAQRAQTAHDKFQHYSTTTPVPAVRGNSFDWLAIGIVIVIAAVFDVVAHLYSQPPTSLTPIAVLSAIGCGLLITALRKLRTVERPGLFEAAAAGFFLAAAQFLSALSYPGVFSILVTNPDQRPGFLITWALVIIFSILFSIIGALLGHLAFAPLRPMPSHTIQTEVENSAIEDNDSNDGIDLAEVTSSEGEDLEAEAASEITPSQSGRSLLSYVITVLLLGLAPFVVGYVFSAVYDYILGTYSFTPGPYPTIRLLSAILPWQIPMPLNVNRSILSLIIFTSLWRIPLFLGNPTIFDVQALEPFVLNGAALSLLLLTLHERSRGTVQQVSPPAWPLYLLLEALFGVLLVLPSDLIILGGLQGLLQIPDLGLTIPIRTLHLLDPLTFTLNLITGLFTCLTIGLLLRIFKRSSSLEEGKG